MYVNTHIVTAEIVEMYDINQSSIGQARQGTKIENRTISMGKGKVIVLETITILVLDKPYINTAQRIHMTIPLEDNSDQYLTAVMTNIIVETHYSGVTDVNSPSFRDELSDIMAGNMTRSRFVNLFSDAYTNAVLTTRANNKWLPDIESVI